MCYSRRRDFLGDGAARAAGVSRGRSTGRPSTDTTAGGGIMRFGKAWVWAVAAGALLLSTTAARADTVTYITSGVFDSGDTAGTSQYTDTAHGITVSFVSSGVQVADVTFGPTLATFGQF